MVLEKTLESSLDCKEIQPVHSKGSLGLVHWDDPEGGYGEEGGGGFRIGNMCTPMVDSC